MKDIKEQDLIAYLYGELEGAEKEKVEKYLLENPAARKEIESFQQLRKVLTSVEDKEVIAPPIFVDEQKQRWLWNAPYFKTIASIAASLLLLMMVAKFSGARLRVTANEFRLSFGEEKPLQIQSNPQVAPALSAEQVQQMINQSLDNHNTVWQANWDTSQKKLDGSIRNNLALNSGKMNQLVREASAASKEQIQQYVSTLQAENLQIVKDYFQLTSVEQKQYIEGLLVDFAKYLQQQRNDDLQLVQLRLNHLEQNTNVFQQETEQILSSIISTVGNTAATREVKY